MSASRLGRNWADVDEEDEDDVIIDASSKGARCFETPVDEHGIKSVIEYKERDGKTYKVTKRVKQTTMTKWINPEMVARKSMEKFGAPVKNGPTTEAQHCIRSVEEVNIDLCRRAVQVSQANDAEDKFLEEALKTCENLFKEKKVWTDINRDKQIDKEGEVAPKPDAAAPVAAAAAAGGAAGGPAKYVPPSVRAAAGGGKGDGKGGKGGLEQQEDASLRITNLSDDVKEGDLQELFGQFGRLQRVYLSKDPNTGLSKGFAFVTYYTKQDAQKAINKLHGHGYDNLILSVQIARPRA
jgi:translation initiation factor 3 subunit G